MPVSGTVNVLPFSSLEGRFASVVGDNGEAVTYVYREDHVCARRDPGTRIVYR